MTTRCALMLLSSVLLLSAPVLAQQDREPTDDEFGPEQAPKSMEEQLRGAQQRMGQDLGDAQQRQSDEFAQISERMAAQYQALEERLRVQREELHQRLAQQWTDVKDSTDKTWVDYGEKGDTRSAVDFDKGEVEVEVLVPLESVAPGKGKEAAPDRLDPKQDKQLRALAEEKLREQMKRMLTQSDPHGDATQPPPERKEPAPLPPEPPHDRNALPPQAPVPQPQKEPKHRPGHKEPAQGAHAQAEPPAPAPKPLPRDAPVMTDQLRGKDGKPVTAKESDKFVKESLAPKLEVDPKLVVGTDGKPRIKVKVKVPMVSEHLKVRADRYAAQIKQQAQRAGVEPALVFAVVHTESAFNPLAQSNAGAYGLMQLIPKQGAHEAYRHIYKTEKIVTPEYLLDPDHNIELGATYLQMLQSSFFGKLKNPENRQVLSIASYNCGPTKVKKSVVGSSDVDSMTPEQVVALVRSRAPQETKDYVVRVRDRMALYRDR